MTATLDHTICPRALLDAYQAACQKPFDWTSNNCGLAAASLVEAVLGEDRSAGYRAACTSALAAMRLLRRKGGFAGIMQEQGLVPQRALQARRGDLVLYSWLHRSKRREALGVCIDYRAAFPGAAGMELIALQRCERSWRLQKGGASCQK